MNVLTLLSRETTSKVFQRSMSLVQHNVELARDGLSAPWGFRLKGGRDVEGGTPLEVIKVRNVLVEEQIYHVLVNTLFLVCEINVF